MKTVGEILKTARQTKNITLEKLSEITRIDASYIQALENDDYSKLPSSTFAKGFIRNLSKALDKNPDELIAVFRRDFNGLKDVQTKVKTRRHISIHLLHSQTALIAIGLFVFLTYLAFQYRAVIKPPRLELDSPKENAIVVSPVNISGHTDPGSTVTINDDLRVSPDNTGAFATKLNLSNGQTEVKIVVNNRFSRSSTKTIPITVISQ